MSDKPKIDDGGPAFPQHEQTDSFGTVLSQNDPGMSLRAWLAGQALRGMLSDTRGDVLGDDETALVCVRHADAVIAALKVQP